MESGSVVYNPAADSSQIAVLASVSPLPIFVPPLYDVAAAKAVCRPSTWVEDGVSVPMGAELGGGVDPRVLPVVRQQSVCAHRTRDHRTVVVE